ncbi:Annexin [Piromyces finnis]|uniref:Annexin n=1 Tax=Piromyces finnis TaxID=1754191 RepID=A0A1Y1VBS7_9FUNG|nr:Annexin [Piromyces finnis]|eukprot:ORX50716.1 Annexin [Piromyces finnis]
MYPPYQQSGAGTNGYPYQGYPPPPPQNQYQGYPPPGTGGYPPPQQNLYQGYPPPGTGGYPPPQQNLYQGYPPPGTGGYPPPTGGYPPTGGGHPLTNMPSTAPERAGSAYPPQPSLQAGYLPPTTQGGYTGYPPPSNTPGAYTGYPPASNGYPPQGSYAGYPPQSGFAGYPPTQGYPVHQQNTVYGTGAYGQSIDNFGLGGTSNLLTADEVTKACAELRDAMKGFGTNEAKLISVLGTYPPIQMNQIIKGYKSHYGKSLESAVDSETSGNFGKLCIALSKSILDFDVYCLHEAISGLGTDEDCLIEILVGRTNSDIQAINDAYKAKYRNSLEKDIRGDTSGYFRALLVALVQGNRDEGNGTRDIRSDVEALYRAGEGRLGTDESTFISILCGRPEAHLRQVFAQYQQKYSHSMEKVIKSEFSGDIKKALINLVKSITNHNEFIAEQFEKSMKGLGTNDDKLIRLTVRYRDPIIIAPIKEAYKTMYGKSLKKRIEGDTSGDYRRLLITCIGENK